VLVANSGGQYRGKDAAIVQLPFPSTAAGHPVLTSYYQHYADRYREEIPEYFVPDADLWELPLWVAHLGGILRAANWHARFIDLSMAPVSADACVNAIIETTQRGEWVLLSPLAQNFSLALEVSRILRRLDRRTVIGGSMGALATETDATRVIRGIATPETLVSALEGPGALAELWVGRRGSISWRPNYKLLATPRKRVPLLRLNASHGCLYACEFCGDNWSRKLHVVERDALEAEVDDFANLFPETKLLYIGDKTFGQSAEAVQNLIEVMARRPGYRLIVQTHMLMVDEALAEAMQQLGVAVVELGFESADEQALRDVRKSNGGERRVYEVLRLLNNAGVRVILNVLGGLPAERPQSHTKTISFIEQSSDLVWLYNLYNFVPYPLTPLFHRLRERIIDWDYAHWREDAPPVFEPFHLSREQSWEFFLEKVDSAAQAIRSTVSDGPLAS
jgi:Radical SAM superfamily